MSVLPPGGAMPILIVDDQAANVMLLGQILTRAGYDIVPAGSGEQALQRARARKPILVLLDMIMPGMDGMEVCQQMRSEPGLADVPVIFLTAATERELLVRAFEAGAVDYITKPFVAEELLARVRTHISLKQAKDHLQRIAREREDVTAIVAHDLKHPIANVRFSAQMLQRSGLQPGRQTGLVDDIVSSCDEALEFIQRFLARRAEIERVRDMHLASTALGPLMDRAISRYASTAETRNVRLVRNGDDLDVKADAALLRNVVHNLLSNALRFAPEGSEIGIHIGPGRAGFARVGVIDAGPGIPEGERQKLFRRFVRINHSRGEDLRGDGNSNSTGLGLAIAKADIEEMNGFLWYEPRPEGGSVFAFELPLA
jgi:two-component system sensor histidine kinase/response regulator